MFDADCCDVSPESTVALDEDSAGSVGACTLSSCRYGVISSDLFFFIGMDGGGIWILSTHSPHSMYVHDIGCLLHA